MTSPATPAGDGARPATVLYIQPTSEIGGADIALYRLVTHLDRSRFRPVVVLPREGPLGTLMRREGVDVRIVPMVQLRPRRSVRYLLGFALAFPPTVVRLARLARRAPGGEQYGQPRDQGPEHHVADHHLQGGQQVAEGAVRVGA